MLTKTTRTWSFETLEGGVAPVEATSFKDAWKAMFSYVSRLLDAGDMSYQLLETGIWIKQPSGAPIMFYDARDIACDAGWLVDGKSTI